MRPFKFVLAPLLLLVAMFCIYGCLASLELSSDSKSQTTWMLGYGLVGSISFLTAVWLLVSGVRQGKGVVRDWED